MEQKQYDSTHRHWLMFAACSIQVHMSASNHRYSTNSIPDTFEIVPEPSRRPYTRISSVIRQSK